MKRSIPLAFALAITGHASPAAAEDAPSWFVPVGMCMTRPCTCADIPIMEKFDANQKNARDAWKSVQKDVLSGTGPMSAADAVALFRSRFAGDPAITTQFQSCPGFDPTKNSVSKVAGVSKSGEPVLDPCFCAAFCADIVQSTVEHEKMHVPTIVLGTIGKGDLIIGCGLHILSGPICNVIAPYTLSSSEIASHDTGILYLDLALDKLRANDPSKPGVACTWMPIAEPSTPRPPAPPPPPGFVDRVRLLFDRIVHGARQ
jgi:hypothetical protein